ncbi:MAG TPA: ROK family protein [Thermoanaerobaculia bacterium]|jgi:polyphosphate glucokinase|nr:ROK family protein [Thermoanaerobaculia bacterium]
MAKKTGSLITFCLDIGGTGIKGFTADATDRPTSERVRLETPRPATPDAVLAVIADIVKQVPRFDRVAAGFPGVVVKGRTLTAPNLDPAWEGFELAEELEKLTGKPARVANDAGVQGLAVIEGVGTELVLTLGTGMGFALYIDGHYVPNIEMAHHPFRKKKTYEELVGNEALHDVGKKRWNRRVEKVIAQLARIFNYRLLYLGGGNAKEIHFDLPANVKTVENIAGLLGGVKLWQQPG